MRFYSDRKTQSMTKFLIRLFIENHENKSDPQVRSAYGMLAGIVGVSINILLFICKAIIGFLSKSIAVLADSFNNLSDAGSFFVSILASKLSKKPADKEHPFGHQRIEYIAALVISLIIMYAGLTLFIDSIKRIFNPQVLVFDWIFIIVLAATMLFKIWLMLFNKNIGEMINSTVQKAAYIDSRNDLIVTTLTIISMLTAKYFSVSLDGFFGIAVSVFVFISGLNIAKTALLPLLGAAADKKIYEKITDKVEAYAGILGTHDLIVHNYGPSNIMATIHAQVPSNSDLQKIHDTIDKIERDVYKEFGISLVIHMDPQQINDVRYFIYKSMVDSIVDHIDMDASIHDFHFQTRNKNILLKFEVCVPHSYTEQQENDIVKTIKKKISETNPHIKCDITVEHAFIES